MAKDTQVYRLAVGFTVLWIMFTSFPALAQVAASPPPTKGSTVEDAVQALAGEIKDLNATIQELRAEVSRSRQETSELRAELHGAIEKLSSPSLRQTRKGKTPRVFPRRGPPRQDRRRLTWPRRKRPPRHA